MAALRARIFVLWAMLLAALPVLAAGERYFCRVSERVLTECCCGGTRAASPPAWELGAELEPEECCERLEVDALSAAPAQRGDGLLEHAALVLIPLPALSFRAVRGRDGAALRVAARAPPLRGPPLFLAHCVFLI